MMNWGKLTFPQTSAMTLAMCLLVSLLSLIYYASSNQLTLLEWELLMVNSTSISFSMLLDKMSLTFSSTVLLISFSVMLFTVTYMSSDPSLNYFIIMVMLFVLSMNFLIYIPHLIFLLLGWDGLGLSSYLLVIYYQNESSLSAGMITAITNRIGDSLLIVAGCWMFTIGTWHQSFNLLLGSGLCLIIPVMFAAMTKSAQMPFSAWLPAAMAAPTPVSSLVHSSTLVTAGVYILIRFYPTLSSFQFFNSYMFWIGFMTSAMAGMAANFENDLKKVIALSTLSQLGVMMLSLGMGQPLLTFMHLVTHALFKALLFLCAGTIIHSMQGTQDLRLMGGLWNKMPATCSCLNIANLALCGIPFTAGFYSKDLILEVMFSSSLPMFTWFMVALTICLTSAYSIRLSLLTLWSPYKHYPMSTKNDESLYTMAPCLILMMGAVSGGAVMSWWTTPYLLDFSLPFTMKVFALMFITAYGMISFKTTTSFIHMPTAQFQISMWFLSHITSNSLLPHTMKLAGRYSTMERSWMELFSGKGTLSVAMNTSMSFMKTQNLTAAKLMYMMVVMLTFVLLTW